MPLPEWVKADPSARIEDGAIVGYAFTEPPPETLIGVACHIRTQAVVYAGARLGARVHVAHGALIREFSRLGDDVSVGSKTVIERDVEIGDRVRIHSAAFIPELTVIEDDAWIGPMVCVTNARYPMMGPIGSRLTGVTIKKGAQIGAASVLLPGITVGERALVGAGSVVTHDVAPGSVVVGNPARVISTIDDIEGKLGAR